MKLFAHRGWTSGEGENGPAYFERAAAAPFVDGIEFDIRLDDDGLPIVTHDPVKPGETPLTLHEALDILGPSGKELFVELKDGKAARPVMRTLIDRHLAERSVVFGFPRAVHDLPFESRRPMRLGVIAHIPWQANSIFSKYAPDIIMAGWDKRTWTRRTFKTWWSMFSLPKLRQRHNAPIALGIVRSAADYHWLDQRSCDIAVADFAPDKPAHFFNGDPVKSVRKY